jgi:hypothetical protein
VSPEAGTGQSTLRNLIASRSASSAKLHLKRFRLLRCNLIPVPDRPHLPCCAPGGGTCLNSSRRKSCCWSECARSPVLACSAQASRTVAGPTAEARTEAGLMGAAGATRTAAARMEVAVGRGTPVVADHISVPAGPVVAEVATSSVEAAEAAAVLAAVDRRVVRRWRDRAADDNLAVAHTAAAPRAPRADIRPVPTAAVVMIEQATAIVAVTAPVALADPVTAVTQGTLVPAMGTVVTARVVAEAMALRDPAAPTAAATPVRARTAPTETPTRTRVPRATLTVPHRIAATSGWVRPAGQTRQGTTVRGEPQATAATPRTADTIRIVRQARSGAILAVVPPQTAETGARIDPVHATHTIQAAHVQRRMTQIGPVAAP